MAGGGWAIIIVIIIILLLLLFNIIIILLLLLFYYYYYCYLLKDYSPVNHTEPPQGLCTGQEGWSIGQQRQRTQLE